MSGVLAAKNRRLAVRARFFDALSQFQSELRPDAPPQMVLQAIGQTAVAILGTSSAAVFSVIPGQAYAEVILCDGQGDVFEQTVIDCPPARAACSCARPSTSGWCRCPHTGSPCLRCWRPSCWSWR